MRKPLIHSLLLALVFMSTSCGNAKFNGKGKKKDKKQADVVVVEPENPPVTCKPGETCVVVDPDKCKAGETDCPVPVPTPTPTPTNPPVDDCKDGKDGSKCPVPTDDCDDEPGQNPSQNPGKECPSQNDDAGQNNPAQHK